jgi:hypothetical protein
VLLESGRDAQGLAPLSVIDAETGAPVPGAEVRYWALEGSIEIGPHRQAEWVTRSDVEGRTVAAVHLAATGAGLLAAQLANGSGHPVVLLVRTEAVTHELAIHAPPSIRAGETVPVRITAADHSTSAVVGAALVLDGYSDAGEVTRGTVRELGGGDYEGQLSPPRSGTWTLVAWDRATRAEARLPVQVVPGAPERIDIIGDADPRAQPPYDRVMIRARLVDRHGNTLDPRRLRAAAESGSIIRGSTGDEARLVLRRHGSGDCQVDVEDPVSGVRRHLTVPFAPLWLTQPGVIEPGECFVTELRALPSPGRTFTRAAVQITFDAERATYAGLRPAGVAEIDVTTPPRIVNGNRLEFEVATRAELAVEQWPQGIPLCALEWRCTGAGTTCFQVEGAMSPPVPGWMVCTEQKFLIENIRCVCVNVIYRSWHRPDRALGTAMIRQAFRVIAGNTYFCCPVLRPKLDFCEITPADYLTLRRLWGGAVKPYYYPEDFDALFDSGICEKADCINLYVLPIGNSNINGVTRRSTGAIVIDPDRFQQIGNLGAHEFGHALGLDDREDSYRLMGVRSPHGHYISSEECRTIWATLENYPCT